MEKNYKEALELKNKGLTYIQVIDKLNLNIAPNTLLYHLKKIGYKPKKLSLICQNNWCQSKFEIYDYKYNCELHKKCKKCRDYEKICEICKKPHNNQALTCGKKCAYELRKKSWSESCGTPHNFSKNSISRKKWEKILFENSGITNVFQLDSVKKKSKETLIKKYGVSHNMFVPELIVQRRINGEKNGLFIPLNELSNFQIYKYNVLSFTIYNLRIFGETFLGNYWKEQKKINTDHIDHIFSIKEGFMKNIPAYIIGSIVNLRLLYCKYNISKGYKSDISIDELLYKYNEFEKNDNHKKLLDEMKSKRSKYYEIYFKLKEKYEN